MPPKMPPKGKRMPSRIVLKRKKGKEVTSTSGNDSYHLTLGTSEWTPTSIQERGLSCRTCLFWSVSEPIAVGVLGTCRDPFSGSSWRQGHLQPVTLPSDVCTAPVLFFSPTRDVPTSFFSGLFFSGLFFGSVQRAPLACCSHSVVGVTGAASLATGVCFFAGAGGCSSWRCSLSGGTAGTDEDGHFWILFIQNDHNPGLIRELSVSCRVSSLTVRG